MSAPVILPTTGTPLWLQTLGYLRTDTDPQLGLVAALGARANDAGVYSGLYSIYPNYDTDGPSADRTVCPVPFLIVMPGGAKARPDGAGRDLLVAIEIHDDPTQGILRWQGLFERLERWLAGWAPTNDGLYRYIGGMEFESESATLPDDRYETESVQVVFKIQGVNRTSLRGRQG